MAKAATAHHRLPRAEGEAFRCRLLKWTDQASVQRELDAFREQWGSQITKVGGGKVWCETYDGLLAARSLGYQVELRLTAAGAKADLELLVDSKVIQIQHVRILTDEQRRLNAVDEATTYDPDNEINQVLAEVDQQLKRKAAKGYDPSFILLVHVEMFNFASRRAEVLGKLLSTLANAGQHFEEIWIVWQGKLHRYGRGDPHAARCSSG